MKLNIGASKPPELYLVRLQSIIPKFIDQFKNGSRTHSMQGLRKGMTLRVMATSDKDAQKKALLRKSNPLTRKCSYVVRWSRPFYA